MKHYVIDIKEQDKPFGTIAADIACMLRGKNTPQFTPNVVPAVQVLVKNASSIKLSDKKLAEDYTHYTGYPGGLRHTKKSKVVATKGYSEVLRRAVYGMLPKNKLRSIFIKNLVIEE